MPLRQYRNRLAALLIGAMLASQAHAALVLRCQIDQGYKSQVYDFAPTANPYTAAPVEVRSRFRFKAVLVGDAQAVDYAKLYVYYYLQGQPVLMQMAHYSAPQVVPDSSPGALTGLQRVYSPRLGHEMRYQCALRESAP